MKTLDELVQKVDTFAINQVQVCKALDTIAESQGKLLASIDEHDGLLAKAIDHIRVSLNELDGKVQAIGGVLAELLAKPKAKRRRK